MQFSALLVLSFLFVANGAAVGSLRGGAEEYVEQDRQLEVDIEIDSGYDYTAGFEITLELKEGGRRKLGVETAPGQVKKIELISECEEDDIDCQDKEEAELEDPADPLAVPASDNVMGKALGLEGLKAITRATKRKFSKDSKILKGVDAYNCTVDVQEIVQNPPDSRSAGRRQLQRFGYISLKAHYTGRCGRLCGGDDNDQRRQLVETGDAQIISECESLAGKILTAAGKRAELLPNVCGIGLKMIVPGYHLTEPIECWYASPSPSC